MAVAGPNELLTLLVLFFSSGFGLPVGVPPEPVDPVLVQVAPDECLFYAAWAGMADPDPASENRTERLLAEPEVQQLISAVTDQLGEADDAGQRHAEFVAHVRQERRLHVRDPFRLLLCAPEVFLECCLRGDVAKRDQRGVPTFPPYGMQHHVELERVVVMAQHLHMPGVSCRKSDARRHTDHVD